MQPVSNKVVAATAAAGSVTGPAVIVLWVLAMLHTPGISMPPPELIGIAIGQVTSQAGAFLGGYFRRELNLPTEPQGGQP